MGAARPAYEACRWPAQDAANRRWVGQLTALLEAHEAGIARRLGALYAKPLGGLPIRVDVVETVNWSGATTILLDPEGGHILASKSEQGFAALELIFHEASHTLMGREHPIQQALTEAAERLALPLPGDLWHAVLFYATGDTVARVLAEAGETGYTPMMFGGDIFASHHQALLEAWSRYLSHERSLDEAAGDLLQAVARARDGDDRE